MLSTAQQGWKCAGRTLAFAFTAKVAHSVAINIKQASKLQHEATHVVDCSCCCVRLGARSALLPRSLCLSGACSRHRHDCLERVNLIIPLGFGRCVSVHVVVVVPDVEQIALIDGRRDSVGKALWLASAAEQVAPTTSAVVRLRSVFAQGKARLRFQSVLEACRWTRRLRHS